VETKTPIRQNKKTRSVPLVNLRRVHHRIQDRFLLGDQIYLEKLIKMGSGLTGVMVFGGKIVGTWKKTAKRDLIEIKLSPFAKLDAEEESAFENAAKRYGAFKETPINVVYEFTSQALLNANRNPST
jgi:hypothetical protein